MERTVNEQIAEKGANRMVDDVPHEIDDSNDDTRMWSHWSLSSGKIIPIQHSKKTTIKKGYYDLQYDTHIGYFLVEKEQKTNDSKDELLELPYPEREFIMTNLKRFLSKKSIYKDYDIVYKRGFLLYGKQGGGKSGLVRLICDEILEKTDAAIFDVTEGNIKHLMRFIPNTFRKLEKDRLLVFLIEDIDSICDNGYEHHLINFIDGGNDLENVIFLATTNHIEKIHERIAARPSRFDVRLEIKDLNEECRKYYIENKVKARDLEAFDMNKLLKDTEGFSISQLKEFVISHVILGVTYEETIKNLQNFGIIESSHKYGNSDGKVKVVRTESSNMGFTTKGRAGFRHTDEEESDEER